MQTDGCSVGMSVVELKKNIKRYDSRYKTCLNVALWKVTDEKQYKRKSIKVCKKQLRGQAPCLEGRVPSQTKTLEASLAARRLGLGISPSHCIYDNVGVWQCSYDLDWCNSFKLPSDGDRVFSRYIHFKRLGSIVN